LAADRPGVAHPRGTGLDSNRQLGIRKSKGGKGIVEYWYEVYHIPSLGLPGDSCGS
jgi:hypothetical protein